MVWFWFLTSTESIVSVVLTERWNGVDVIAEISCEYIGDGTLPSATDLVQNLQLSLLFQVFHKLKTLWALKLFRVDFSENAFDIRANKA